MKHTWTDYTSSSGKLWHVHGTHEQVVDPKQRGKGFLWVFKKLSGYSPTVAEAKEMIEILAEAGDNYRQLVS
jgi:hypothetical protein